MKRLITCPICLATELNKFMINYIFFFSFSLNYVNTLVLLLVKHIVTILSLFL